MQAAKRAFIKHIEKGAPCASEKVKNKVKRTIKLALL